MKIIYQEKDNPNGIGEFEILDREQINLLSKYTDDFLEVSDKDFKLPNRIDDSDDERKKKTKYKSIHPKHTGSQIPYHHNYKKPYKQQGYYQQGGIPIPYNMGYPPSKHPSYHSQGSVKIPYYHHNIGDSHYYYHHYKKLKLCTYRYTYLWLRNGKSFWCYPTYIGRNTISGWKWKNYKWKFFSMSIRRISNFYCYR